MRVLLAHPGAELYGSDRMVLETVTAAVAADCDVTVVLPNSGPLVEQLQARGADVEVSPVQVLRKELLGFRSLPRLAAGFVAGMLRALSLVRAQSADLVITNTITQPIWIFAARLTGRRVIVHVHEAERQLPRFMAFALLAPLSLAHRVIVVSSTTEEFVKSGTLTLPPVQLIPNGIDLTRFNDIPLRDFARNPELLVVGRLSPRKGQDIVVRAMDILRHRGIEVRATFAGDVFPGYEWYRDELYTLVHDLGLWQQCSFPGFVDDVRPMMARAHICVVPSRQAESFGLAAVEAMASCRPTVVSDLEGLLELVEHGVNGLVFHEGSEEDLASVLESLISARERHGRLGAAGRRFVRDRFDLAQYRERIGEAIRETCGTSLR